MLFYYRRLKNDVLASMHPVQWKTPGAIIMDTMARRGSADPLLVSDIYRTIRILHENGHIERIGLESIPPADVESHSVRFGKPPACGAYRLSQDRGGGRTMTDDLEKADPLLDLAPLRR